MGIPEANNSPQNNLDQDDVFQNIDLDKVALVLKKSLPWILFILIFTNSISYIYNRYTQPIYESESILKLDIKSEASILGLGVQNPMGQQQDLNSLSGEIELLKSRLFFKKVVSAINQNVSYFHPGRSNIVDERYGNSPFVVSYKFKNTTLFNKKFDFLILDDTSFELTYEYQGVSIQNEYEFGKPIENDAFNFLIEKTAFFEGAKSVKDYYFIINSEEHLIDYLVENIRVEPVNFSAKTIKIALEHTNRTKVRDLVIAIDTLYLNYTKEEKNKAIEQKIDFLEGQLKKTTKELETYESFFEKFTIENKTIDLSKDLSKTIVLLNSLDSQRINLRAKISNVNLLSKQINANVSLPLSPFELGNFPGFLQESITSYNKLLAEKELKLTSYNENTFVIQQVNQKLSVANKNAKEQISEFRKILLDELEESKIRRSSLESNFIELPSMGTEYNKNKRFYNLHEESYLTLIQSKIQLEISRAGTVTNFVVLSPASLPTTPIHPQKLMIIGIGIVAGLVLSFFFVLIKYLLHNKISSHSELEKLISSPILGLVPFYNKEKLDITKLVIDDNPKSSISEALRSIRTNIEFLLPNFYQKVISVTSTVSGEGKTFIAVNLGAILAYSKLKVVVVDLDMRKPKVHLAFGQEKNANGVSTILIDKSTIKESINKTSINNLDYIAAGPIPPNPSELMIGDEFSDFTDKLKALYDIVIFDTPPVGLVTDAILSMKYSDLPIYVVRADYSKKNYMKSVNSLAANDKFKNLCVILNSVKSNKNQGYGYGYGYGQSYGHGYYDDAPQKSKWYNLFSKK